MHSANGHVARALTIAGSDSGGGAGIQADLKTMHQFGVYGTSVITALTAQNTIGVQAIHEVDAPFVRQQLRSVLDDIGTDAVKTGMLANESVMLEVANTLREYDLKQVVVDPVMVAKGGQPLVDHDSIDAMRTHLLPMAAVVTPNLPEASALCGYPLNTWSEYLQAVKDLASFGAQTVILKGGHAHPDALNDVPWIQELPQPFTVDIVYQQEQYTYFITPRVNSAKTHGTGCTFSAAIAALSAKGTPLLEAIATARAFIFQAIDRAKDWDVGAGHGPTDHSVAVSPVGTVQATGVYLFDARSWSRIA